MKVNLTPDQIKYLSIFNGLKSFARQEELDRKLGHEKQIAIRDELISMDVLKITKSGALRGPSYYDLRALISMNTKTLADLQQEEKELLESLELKKADYKQRQATDRSFCYYSRDLDESIAYNNECLIRNRKLQLRFIQEGK